MFEIGHNLNNYHSGEGTEEYGDGTCMMGSHIYEDDRPQMCFNGAKSWWFGWYSDRHVSINPAASSWQGKLVGVDDYVSKKITADDQHVIARIEMQSSPDLYLMYNQKKGVNSEVQEMPDTVTVVEQDGEVATSWLLAGVTERSQPFRYLRWNGGSDDLVIRVCRRVKGSVDYAEVLVFLDNENNKLFCPPKSPPKASAPPDVVPRAAPDLPTVVHLSTGSGTDFYRETNKGKVSRGNPEHELFSLKQTKHAFRFRPTKKSRIPAGAVILSAILMVYPTDDSINSRKQMSGHVVGNAVGNARGYQKGVDKEITTAPKTTSNVTIGPNVKPWRTSAYQKFVEVAPVIEEIVARNDYTEGNAIKLFLIGDDKTTSRKIKTSSGRNRPKLRVTYSLIPFANAGEEQVVDVGVPFTVDGSNSRGPISKYIWEFGDGNRIVSASPIAKHTYEMAGSFEVTLTVENAGGDQRQDTTMATAVATADANINPTAVMTCPSQGNVLSLFSFNASDSYDLVDVSTTTYLWDFGDGNQTRSISPSIYHQFEAPGQYNVSLTVKDVSGKQGSTTCIVTVVDWIEIELQISHEKDNYIESSSGTPTYGLTTHRLWSPGHELQAYRFRSVGVPQKATILEARLEMMPKGSSTVNQVISGIVKGEAVGRPRPYRNVPYQISNATLTASSVSVAKLPGWKSNRYSSLGDVAPVVQEIVNRNDYQKGNPIKLILINQNSPGSRRVLTFNSGAGAKLIIRYR